MDSEHKDRLEKFIIDNRSEFDYVDPPGEIWEKVQPQIRSEKQDNESFGWVWKVAATIFFALTVYLSIDKFTQENIFQDEYISTNDYGFQEFQNTEKYYTEVIQVKRKELDMVLENEKVLNIEFGRDIAELDSMYMLLKKDFEVNNDELVVNAMIYNLRLRIEILDRQLQIIKNLNTIEQTRNEDEGRNI